MLRPLVVLMALAVPLAAAPVPKAIKPRAAALDGKWEIVELWSGLSDVAKLNPWVWDIRGESLTIYRRDGDKLEPNDPITKTTLVRPADGGPDALDYIRDDRGNAMTFPGIVTVTEGELVICFDSPGKSRPTEQKPFQSGWYYKFKRVTEK
jgi:uncharacterized protein (TIGR03067 family)